MYKHLPVLRAQIPETFFTLRLTTRLISPLLFSPNTIQFTFSFLNLLIYLTAPGLNCGMWDLVPLPEEPDPSPSALGTRSLSHWTIKGVPHAVYS